MLDKNTKVDEKLLLEVERRCNEAIMKGTPVTVKTVEFSEENRPESLPKDYVGGFIRNVIIDSIDDNPCCGTHVKSLSDLLCVKLGIHENVRGGNIKVPFYVGQRVIDAFHFSLGNEKKLSILLSDAPERHPDAVTRLNKQQREMNKTIRNILKDFAMSTAQGMIQKLTSGNSDNGDASTIISHHYENGNLDYVHVIASELDRYIKSNGDATQRPFCVVVSAGSTNDGGPVFIVGNQDSLVKKCADVAAEMVSGLKGGGRGCKWQGKSSSWKGLDKLHAALEKLD
ncbi:Alanyl-tRNA editing protein Aarsd1-B [Zancudomyces culisetae]|nr:Alanyl-tRNA editing protein Aarsd1-B [Zancudomyces culisetae]|eukprot:OMH81228.1 Alanyl-tRNA editing protein Aarsd1-B [Zancudomyces culisetae]